MKPWLRPNVYFWETAPFFRLLSPVVLAIIAYDKSWLPVATKQALFASVFAAFITTVFVLSIGKHSLLLTAVRFLLIHTTIFIATWLLCFVQDVRNNPSWFGKDIQPHDVFIARILTDPAEKERTWKLTVEVEQRFRNDTIVKTKGQALLYVYKDKRPLTIRNGDRVVIPSKWISIQNAGNPYEFDYRGFCNRNNIFYQQFIVRADIQLHEKAPAGKSFIQETHQWAMKQLGRHIYDAATLGLLQAMLLGESVNFDNELRQGYSETGIIHIVAISGSHVMIFFQIIALLFFWLKNKRYAFIKYVIAVPIVCFYVAVAGAPTSAVRAAIMFSFLAFGMLIQKDRQPLNQLFATAFFMLLYEPMWLFSVGFQLSFGAVLSLILFYKPIVKLVTIRNIFFRKIWETIVASIAAEIIVAPVVIYYFHLLPASFLIANVVAYGFMSVILSLGLLLVLAGNITSIAAPLADCIEVLVKWFNRIISILQGWNPSSFKHLHLSLIALLLVYAVITGFSVFLLKKHSKGLVTGLVSFCLLLLLLISEKWESLQQQKFVAYNINRKGYVEIINGNYFLPVINDSNINPSKDFATKEGHIISRAWHQDNNYNDDIIIINTKKILLLRQPLTIDTSIIAPVDFLLINYPVHRFNGNALQQVFRFKKLIVTGAQKRYRVEQWKDSCMKYNIPAHFTLLDGAFVLK